MIVIFGRLASSSRPVWFPFETRLSKRVFITVQPRLHHRAFITVQPRLHQISASPFFPADYFIRYLLSFTQKNKTNFGQAAIFVLFLFSAKLFREEIKLTPLRLVSGPVCSLRINL